MDILEDVDGTVLKWHTEAETERLRYLMSPLHKETVSALVASGERKAGTIFRRMRPVGDGTKQQRAEVRFDGTAGCLRTPGGGSSRQFVIVVDGGAVRTRLLSPVESARLMGLPDSYHLPESLNEALHLTGDGLVVDVISFLRDSLLELILRPKNLLVACAT